MLFDSTLRRDLARNFGATLVVILTIVLTMMLIRTLGQAAGGKIAPQDVVLLLGYVALGHLPTPGERVTVDDFEIEVEDVRRRALVSALARRVRPEMHGEEQR